MLVKCADCGFLAVVQKKTGQILSPTPDYRRTGHIETTGSDFILTTFPYCSVSAHDLRAGIETIKERDDEPRKFVLQQLRACDRFIKWMPGFSPKEHQEMIHQQEMRDWQDRREKADQEFQAEQYKNSRRHERMSLVIAVAAIVVGAIASLAAAMIPLFRADPPATIIVQPAPVVIQPAAAPAKNP